MKALNKCYMGFFLTGLGLVELYLAATENFPPPLIGVFIGMTGIYVFFMNVEDAHKEERINEPRKT